MEPNCVSYNMEDISGSPSIAKCELNNSTHNEHPDDFKPSSNYIYRGSEVSVDYKKNKKAKSVSYYLTFVDYTCKCGLQRRLPNDVCQLL